MNRVMMAAGVAVVNSHHHKVEGHTLKSGVSSFHPSVKRIFSGGESSNSSSCEIRALSGVVGSVMAGGFIGDSSGDHHDRRKQADDSLRKVMYLNCWGQN